MTDIDDVNKILNSIREPAKAGSLDRVVVLLNREELNLLCGAIERYAGGLDRNAANYRATAFEQPETSEHRKMWSKIAIRCERDARKQYERLKELKALDVKMQHKAADQRPGLGASANQ